MRTMNNTTKLPALKAFFNILFLIGAVMLSVKIFAAFGNRFLDWRFTFFEDSLFWMVGPLAVTIIGAVGTELLAANNK